MQGVRSAPVPLSQPVACSSLRLETPLLEASTGATLLCWGVTMVGDLPFTFACNRLLVEGPAGSLTTAGSWILCDSYLVPGLIAKLQVYSNARWLLQAYEYNFQARFAYQMKLSPLPSKSNQLLLGVLFYLLDCRHYFYRWFLVPVGWFTRRRCWIAW